jgi:hypothetical protein
LVEVVVVLLDLSIELVVGARVVVGLGVYGTVEMESVGLALVWTATAGRAPAVTVTGTAHIEMAGMVMTWDVVCPSMMAEYVQTPAADDTAQAMFMVL